jgi:hypothetical protein
MLWGSLVSCEPVVGPGLPPGVPKARYRPNQTDPFHFSDQPPVHFDWTGPHREGLAQDSSLRLFERDGAAAIRMPWLDRGANPGVRVVRGSVFAGFGNRHRDAVALRMNPRISRSWAILPQKRRP